MFVPTFKLLFPDIDTLALESSATASTFIVSISDPTVIVYSVVLATKSESRLDGLTFNDFKFLLFDFSSSFLSSCLTSGFVVVKRSVLTYAVWPLYVTLLHPLLPIPVLFTLSPCFRLPIILLLVL